MVTKKICLVIPSLQAGGMERVMAELAGHFAAKEGVEVHLILYDLSREIFYQVPQGVLIHKPTFGFNNNWRMFYTIKTLIFLRKTIIKINPDSILSFGEYWNSFLLLSVIGLKFPVFVSDRGQPDKSLGWFQDLLRHWLYPKAKGLIFQTEKAKQIYLKKNKHKNIIVIGNPVKQIISDEPVIKREKIVLMVGRLIITKHQDKLIEMFADIDLPDWKLMIVGYDHLKQNNLERLKKLAKDLKIEERVIFAGKVEDLKEIYLKSSLFAFTSSSEGFPNAIGEAMSAGLPVVAFDCVAGPSEMIRDKLNGYLIPLNDYNQFREKLKILMLDEDVRNRMGFHAARSVTPFSVNEIGEKYLNFILS